MRAYFIVVDAVICRQPTQVFFPQHHDMVETFASDRSDQLFNMTVLPRRAWRDRPVPNAHRSQPARDSDTVGGVTVTNEIAGCLIPRECLSNLSGDPIGSRICGRIDQDKPSALQTQDDQPI